MTTRILLICAAAPERPDFPADEPPSPVALMRLKRLPLATGSVCYCSPLRRARDTAHGLGVTATVAPALAETDFGQWQGRDPAQILARDGKGFAAWLADPTAAPHGGESFTGMAARMTEWLEAWAGTDRQVVAITHPGPIQAAVLHVLGAPPGSARALGVTPLSRIRLSHDGRRWALQLGS